ncbi:MAG TPA: type II toxin-antitoxin system RelE/ParE family toxin [Longimicrobiaceae bacterium]|nr:type II toxin-antitoxin system RelE/ParE family toxin [Longimicrobiaceae bacterium]
MKPAIFDPQAEAEFAQAVAFYRRESEALAAEFADAVELAVSFTAEHPAAGTPVRGEIRRWLVRRFPYSIIYRESPPGVYILAVAHQRQRPEYWSDRT